MRTRTLAFDRLEPRIALAGLPTGAAPADTGEFLLGDVLVTVVFLESDGSLDASLEDWTPASRQRVQDNIRAGLEWWEDLLAAQGSVHALHFAIDFTFADDPVPTRYEPIARPSDDFVLWVDEFLNHVGYQSPADFSDDIRAFNHAQRLAHGTDWAFTIFVASAAADLDGQFAAGGEFRSSFAFAGGRFLVMPSERPASAVAHETGHMFWAFDEYAGGKSYFDRRGYYNTQNLNARDDHPQPELRVTSIMDSHAAAFPLLAASPSALEMIGWRDQDGNGVFDVLDVPHQLTGSGRYDPQTASYHFLGSSSVRTLPNLNPSGLGSDISLNRIRQAEYRLDDGPWLLAATFDSPVVELNLPLGPLPADFQSIEIRTVDTSTGVSSRVFRGGPHGPAMLAQQGIQGFIFQDDNLDATIDDDEPGLAGWTVRLLDAQQQPLATPTLLADQYQADAILNSVVPGMTLSATGVAAWDSGVIAVRNPAPGDDLVLGSYTAAGPQSNWSGSGHRLRIDLETPATQLRIDATGVGSVSYGRLEAYDAHGRLLARHTTGPLADGETATLNIGRDVPEIAYAVAYAHGGTSIRLDNVRTGPETTTTTDALGNYALAHVPAGQYVVAVEAPSGWALVDPQDADQPVTIEDGQTRLGVAVAARRVNDRLAWHHADRPWDVDGDNVLSPIDALLVINDLNRHGSRWLAEPAGSGVPPPFVDVSGDGYISPLDALLVINELNMQASRPGGTAQRATSDPRRPAESATAEAEPGNVVSLGERDAATTRLSPVITMTNQEQLLLELINRARANPAAEASRLGISLNAGLGPGAITTTPKPPLAPHQALITAAQAHAQDMLDRGFFAHTNPDGLSASDRAAAAGYPAGAGENIAWWGTTGTLQRDAEVARRHDALFLSPGHRQNMLLPTYREGGTGIRFGPFQGFNAILVTETFGARTGDPYLTGVAFTDTVVADNFYSIGEGIGGVTITAVDNSSGASFATTAGPSGGYALAIPPGAYTVSAVGVGDSAIVVRDVNVGTANVKLDFDASRVPARPPWQNPVDWWDVDGDGLLAPLDPLLVINELNRAGPRPLPAPVAGGPQPPPYLDVTGDGFLSPLDALQPINALNEASRRALAARAVLQSPGEVLAARLPDAARRSENDLALPPGEDWGEGEWLTYSPYQQPSPRLLPRREDSRLASESRRNRSVDAVFLQALRPDASKLAAWQPADQAATVQSSRQDHARLVLPSLS